MDKNLTDKNNNKKKAEEEKQKKIWTYISTTTKMIT